MKKIILFLMLISIGYAQERNIKGTIIADSIFVRALRATTLIATDTSTQVLDSLSYYALTTVTDSLAADIDALPTVTETKAIISDSLNNYIPKNFTRLTEASIVDGSEDYVPIYNTDTELLKKTPLNNLPVSSATSTAISSKASQTEVNLLWSEFNAFKKAMYDSIDAIWNVIGQIDTIDTPTPLPPTNLALFATTGDTGSIRLDWTIPTGEYDSVQVWRGLNTSSYTQIASLDSGDASYTDYGLTANVVYYYKLRSINGAIVSDFTNYISGYVVGNYNLWYVDNAATGNGTATSWTNAATSFSALPWSLIEGGDTVYVSGGNSSKTYVPQNIASKGTFSPHVVITKGKDSGHSGEVIIYGNTATEGSYCKVLRVASTGGLKFTDMTLFIDYPVHQYGFGLREEFGEGNIYDNMHFKSEGNGVCMELYTSYNTTISNSLIEVLPNTKWYEQDPIQIAYGNGGHTITGNTIKYYNSYSGSEPEQGHRDVMHIRSMGVQSGSDMPQTTISNNFIFADIPSGITNAGIYLTGSYSQRFLIENNIIYLDAPSDMQPIETYWYRPGETDRRSYNQSLRVLNNTIVSTASTSTGFLWVTGADTVMVRNNIMYNTNQTTGWVMVIAYDVTDYNATYKSISNNRYYNNDLQNFLQAASGTSYLTFAQWEALGVDVNSEYFDMSFAQIGGLDIADYFTTAGRDSAVDLSSYFTTDIRDTTRTGTWDIGALEYKEGDGGLPNAPTSVVASDHDNLEFTVTWVESGLPDSIAIFAGTSADPTTRIATIAGGIKTYNYTSITDEAYWYVRLKAKKDGVWSDYSSADVATVDSVMFVPSASSDFATDGTSYWTPFHCTRSYETTFMRGTATGGDPVGFYKSGSATFKTGQYYYISVDIKASNFTGVPTVDTGNATVFNLDGGNCTNDWKTFTKVVSIGDDIMTIRTGTTDQTAGWTFDLDNIRIAKTPPP